MSAREKKPTSSLSTVDWVEAALRVMGEDGLEAVHVTKIAARLHVTKGSFYWHFKDRRALLDAMLERWANDRTNEIMSGALRGIEDPHERIRKLEKLSREVAPVDRAMRMWASKDPAAAEAVKKADKQAFEFLVEAITALGFSPAEATVRARIFILIAVGAYSVDPFVGREPGTRGSAAEIGVILGR